MDKRFIDLAQEMLRERTEFRDSVALESTIGQSALAGSEGIAEQKRVEHLVEIERQAQLSSIEAQEAQMLLQEKQQRENQERVIGAQLEKETKINKGLLRSFAEFCLPKIAQDHSEDAQDVNQPKFFDFKGYPEPTIRALQSSVMWVRTTQDKRQVRYIADRYDDGGKKGTYHTKRYIGESKAVHPIFIIGSWSEDKDSHVLLGLSAFTKDGRSPSDYKIPSSEFFGSDWDYEEAVRVAKSLYRAKREISEYSGPKIAETMDEFVERRIGNYFSEGQDIHKIYLQPRQYKKLEEHRRDILSGEIKYTANEVAEFYNAESNITKIAQTSLGSLSSASKGRSKKVRLFYNTEAQKITLLSDEAMTRYKVLGNLIRLSLSFGTEESLNELLEKLK